MKHFGWAAALVLLFGLVLAGCIVSDDLTTITIHRDGSAELIVFHANLRSSETGAKAEQELRQHVESFDARTDPDLVRIVEAGGEIIEARWIHREAPCSNVVAAKFPTAAALEKFLTLHDDQGGLVVESHFTQDGDRRRLTLLVLPTRNLDLAEPATLKEFRQKQADGISETRIAVTDGEIVSARGFTVASDRHSALLAFDEIAALLRADPRRVELQLEWRVPTN